MRARTPLIKAQRVATCLALSSTILALDEQGQDMTSDRAEFEAFLHFELTDAERAGDLDSGLRMLTRCLRGLDPGCHCWLQPELAASNQLRAAIEEAVTRRGVRAWLGAARTVHSTLSQ